MRNSDFKETGDLIGNRYRVDELIGEGGMGQVYSARDEKLGRQVAVKLLLAEVSSRPDAESRFRREARIGAQLNHPNIVKTYDFGRDGASLFLVMELLDGIDLADYLSIVRPLPASDAMEIGLQVSDAMHAAHEKSLVHRDLKPENIFLQGQDILTPEEAALPQGNFQAKVVDFGMAMATEGQTDIGRLTEQGGIAGTPSYMAPEQLRGQEPISASDVYSLGCVLFELLAAVPPYSAAALGELAARHLYAPIPELPAERTDIPPVLRELLRRCLAKSAGRRPTMIQVRRRLQMIIDAKRAGKELSEVDPTTPPPSPTPPPLATQNYSQIASRCALRGDASNDIRMALLAAGFQLVEESELAEGDALLAFGCSTNDLLRYQEAPFFLLADSPAGDMSRVAQLLRLGVEEVVSSPPKPEAVISKLRRAFRLKERAKNKGKRK